MSSQNNLELKGNLSESNLAKLLLEASAARLDGSIRITDNDRKAMIYLRGGEIVFAVSNAREHRLFEMILQAGILQKEHLANFTDVGNDMVFAAQLTEKNVLKASDMQGFFTAQVEQIVNFYLHKFSGEWIFSPLARIKDSIDYRINLHKNLIEYARQLPSETVIKQFKSFQEEFSVNLNPAHSLNLLPQEAFVLSRFETSFLKISDIVALCGISETETLRTIYALWLGGLLLRQNYFATFSDRKVSSIQSAKLQVKRKESVLTRVVTLEMPADEEETIEEQDIAETDEQATISPDDENKQLEDYLLKVEEAETLYQVLNVTSKAGLSDIKSNYFKLAKQFHPDLFHRESGTELHKRIQVAFTELAHAYEILKDEKSRDTYNFRNRKLIDEIESNVIRVKPKQPEVVKVNSVKVAEEIFNEGYDYFIESNYEAAMPLLARAVHLQPQNARYHAFFGKLLSADETSRFKAEAALQQAVKLDSNNPEYRLMLAKFYIDYKLQKRAEGELQRLLAIAPNNSEAVSLLDSLKNK